MKKIFRFALYYLLLVVGLLVIVAGVSWYGAKQNEVRLGLSKPHFPYLRYSQDELDKLYPQYPNANVPTRVTPEQTYAQLLAALKAGDLDAASQQFVAEKQKEWKASLEKIKENGLLEKMIGDLNKKLEKVMMSGALAQYEIGIMKDGEEWGNKIDFIKNADGDWKIKSL